MAQENSEASSSVTLISSSRGTNNNINNSWWDMHGNSSSSSSSSSLSSCCNTTMNNNRSSSSSSSSSSWQQLLHHPDHRHGNPGGHIGIDMALQAPLKLSGEAGESHLWNQVLLNAGSSMNMQNTHGGENFLENLSSKSLSSEMFDPAYDYLKKMDSTWEFNTNAPSLNTLQKELMRSYDGTMLEPERMTNLSNLVINWSIAPPDPQIDHRIAPPSCEVSMDNPSVHSQYLAPSISHIEHEVIPHSQLDSCNGMIDGSTSYKEDSHHQEFGYQIGLNNSILGLNNKLCSGLMTDIPWSNTRSLSDLISFSGCLSKPEVELRGPSNPYGKISDPSEKKKQGLETSLTRVNNRGGRTTSDGKKKRSEDSSETLAKKIKSESPTATSLKVPKVKLTDKITALQQIVSPFGKTDTASVLLEAIKYIKFLHEQVQLLSDPYMKPSPTKDNAWGGLDIRKEMAEIKIDSLRSRGLCLVPISCTPQVYKESSGPDYWTPPYRSCSYR
ncbi:Transcription factor bHLH111 [Ananas comosus]|uniref:Transcription factor bHLH111 n=1 Tax=Ananas comosus TaxID=4615 RepID=A0A199VRZ7_ANACO|nr:Transcription factor bHLH111 [Ananas comosus]